MGPQDDPAIEAVPLNAVLADAPRPSRTTAPAYLLHVYYFQGGVSRLKVTGSWAADAFGPRATSSSCLATNYPRYWAQSDATAPDNVAPSIASSYLSGGSPVGSGTICTLAAWPAAFNSARPGATALGALYPGAAGGNMDDRLSGANCYRAEGDQPAAPKPRRSIDQLAAPKAVPP